MLVKSSQTDQIVTLVISSMKQCTLVRFGGPRSHIAVSISLLAIHEGVGQHSSTQGPLSPVEAFHKSSLNRHVGDRLGTAVGVVATAPYPQSHPHIPSKVAHISR